jgi:hypothetical protein
VVQVTTEKKIAYQSYIDKSFKACNIDSIDDIATNLYAQFAKSDDVQNYITYRYIKTKEALLNTKQKGYPYQSPYQETMRQRELTYDGNMCERLNFLSF